MEKFCSPAEGHAKHEKGSLVKTIHVVVVSIFYLSIDLKRTNEYLQIRREDIYLSMKSM